MSVSLSRRIVLSTIAATALAGATTPALAQDKITLGSRHRLRGPISARKG